MYICVIEQVYTGVYRCDTGVYRLVEVSTGV